MKLFWKIDAAIVWMFKAALWSVTGVALIWGVWWTASNLADKPLVDPTLLTNILLGSILVAVCNKK